MEALAAKVLDRDDASAMLLPYIEQENVWKGLLDQIEAEYPKAGPADKALLRDARHGAQEALVGVRHIRVRLEQFLRK
jgi:hypothetical protein